MRMKNKSKPCKYCESIYHFPFQCYKNPKPRKPINKISDKQKDFKKWLRDVARPFLYQRDGDFCQCCRRQYAHYDIDHIKIVGSNPGLKMDTQNLQFLCRSCHRNKTDRIKCEHFN